ncbi:hypothetical protein HNR16_002846 [Pseudoclavibacter chungangensis]|uniref:hypothetical protein n=1 Tax=Pseudoclavibacter chungangensis TaxID=587635 RepID=UPI0015C9F1FC|nr:hypothetical protein [Pseudoclavibacter chungangensis]NYJ68058.1 hypothetical protein [Pseudoclavibacter chungangensis]
MNEHEPDGTNAAPALDADAISRPAACGDARRDATSWSSPQPLDGITVPVSDAALGSSRIVRGW